MNIYDNEDFFEAYAHMGRSTGGIESAGEWYALKPLIPDLKGKRVLDLGCGYGWHCKYAADNGAEVVLGIDGSEKMIEQAQNRNFDNKIEYRVGEIQKYDYPKEKYDFVISNLALHYIDDLDEIYKKVHDTLREDGVFLFNIEHPVFTSGVEQKWHCDENGNILHWPVDNYYIPGERTTDFLGHTVKKYHHTLTQIVMGLINTGFVIEALSEAGPSEEMAPYMPDELRRPMMLLVKARKQK